MLPSNLIVELTAQELAVIAQAAAELTARSAHITNHTRFSPCSQAETDRVGLTGEYAVAKTFGLGLDACGIRLKGVQMDGGHDIVLPDGTTAQVKAVEVHTNPNRPFWFLMETAYATEFTADVGIMAYVLRNDPGKIKIPGYITRARFHAEHVPVKPRRDPTLRPATARNAKCAAVATCRFDPIEQLIAQVNKASRGAT